MTYEKPRVIARKATCDGRNGVRIEKEVLHDDVGDHAKYTMVPEKYEFGGLVIRDLERSELHRDGTRSSFIDASIKPLNNGGLDIEYTTIEESALKHNKMVVVFS